MTPEQKRKQIQLIEKDVHDIMMQLHHLEFKVDTQYVSRDEFILPLPKVKMPAFCKKLWIGFKQEIKKAP